MAKQYSVVGMNFTQSEDFVKTMATGTNVILVREPKNPYDANAVAVWAAGRKIGYVPKKQNAVLAKFIEDTGRDVIMNGEPCDVAKAVMGMDNALEQTKFINAVFTRSVNSGYPMVAV